MHIISTASPFSPRRALTCSMEPLALPDPTSNSVHHAAGRVGVLRHAKPHTQGTPSSVPSTPGYSRQPCSGSSFDFGGFSMDAPDAVLRARILFYFDAYTLSAWRKSPSLWTIASRA